MSGNRKRVSEEERASNRARWERELGRWRGSGQSLSAWAREQGLSRDALEYWKRKVQGSNRGAAGGRLTLIPVAMPTVAAAPLELLLGTRRLVIPPGFDGDSLRRAIAVLETC